MPKLNVNSKNFKNSGLEFVRTHVRSDGTDHTFISQDVTETASPTFNNLTLTGNLTVEGTQTILSTTILEVEDNIVLLNREQTGIPSSVLVSGIAIERGSQANFYAVFEEATDLFKVGFSSDTSELNWDNLEPVLLREDSPTNGGILVWDSGNVRAESRTTVALDITFTGSNSSSIATGSIISTGGVGISQDIYLGGAINFLGSTGPSTYATIDSNASDVLTITSDQNMVLTSTNGKIDATSDLDITSSTNATNINDGALRTDGGLSVVQDVFIGGSLDVGGALIVNSFVIDSDSSEAFLVRKDGDVGDILTINNSAEGIVTIGSTVTSTTDTAFLKFDTIDANRKIVLDQLADNDHQFNGFGINGTDETRYQLQVDSGSHRFYAATSSTTSDEVFRIQGSLTATNGAVKVFGTGASTSSSTGAFTVLGGTGLGGDVYISDDLIVEGNNTNVISLTASNSSSTAITLTTSNETGGVDINVGTGGLDIDSSVPITTSTASGNITINTGDGSISSGAATAGAAGQILVTGGAGGAGSGAFAAGIGGNITLTAGTGGAEDSGDAGKGGDLTLKSGNFGGTGTGVTAGDIIIDSKNLINIDATSAINIDCAGTSNFTTTTGTLTLEATEASIGQVIIQGADNSATAINITSTNAAGGITLGSGTSGMDVNSTGPITLDSSGTSNFTTITGSLTLSASESDVGQVIIQGADNTVSAVSISSTDLAGGITISTGSAGLDIDSTGGIIAIDTTNTGTGITIGTETAGVPISIGNATSEVTINDNCTIAGDLTVNGTRSIFNTAVVEIDDNILLINAAPGTLSEDAGILARRYQDTNESGTGDVVTSSIGKFAGINAVTQSFGTAADVDTIIILQDAAIQAISRRDQSGTTVNYTGQVDFFNGWWLHITAGTSSGDVRRIKDTTAANVLTITAIADQGGDARVTTSIAHGLSTNDIVFISGSDSPTLINGERTITLVDATNFDIIGLDPAGAGTTGSVYPSIICDIYNTADSGTDGKDFTSTPDATSILNIVQTTYAGSIYNESEDEWQIIHTAEDPAAGGQITIQQFANVRMNNLFLIEDLTGVEGTTINGGTASGDDLTLKSTTNVTKGTITISDALNIDIDAGTNGITIDSGGLLSLDAAGATNLTTSSGDLTLSATTNSVIISAAEAVSDSIQITASAGGITMTSQDTASSWTHTANGAADDLTIAVAGAFDSSLIFNSAGTGVDAIDINATAGGITIDANGGISIDSGGILSINSSAGVINIGNNDIDQNINLGTTGERTVAIGNAVGATGITIDGASGGVSIDSSGNSNFSTSSGTIDIDSSGILSINSSAGAINIGNDAVSQAINLGSGAAARTITIGNTTGTTGIILNAGSGDVTLPSTTNTTTSATGSLRTAGGLAVNKDVYVGTSTTANDVIIYLDAATANNRQLSFLTGGANRWVVKTNATAESGSDAGSDFVFQAFNDSAASLGNRLLINRDNGDVEIFSTSASTSSTSGGLQLDGGIGSDNSTDATDTTNGGGLTLAGGAAIAKKIYIGGTTTLVANDDSSDIGSPALTGSILSVQGQTFEDNATAASGTATAMVFNAFAQPTLDSTNGGAGTEVITTNVATVYIAGAPLPVADKTAITNPYALWVDDGDVQFDGDLTVSGAISSGVSTPSNPTISEIINISVIGDVVTNNIKQIANGTNRLLYITFTITPVATDTLTKFEFTVSDLSTINNTYDIISSINGWDVSGEEQIGNMVMLSKTNHGFIRFTSASTAAHIIQVQLQYTAN